MMVLRAVAAAAFVLLPLGSGAVSLGAQLPRIAIIDFYGVRTVDASRLRHVLAVVPGDTFPADRREIERRLARVPGVVAAHLNGVCCENGGAIMYVGIAERGQRRLSFLPSPRGTVRLPDDVVRSAAAFDSAVMRAVTRGDVAEDDSQGHALNRDSSMRAIQERYVGFATRDLSLLRDVLHHSSNAAQRAIAAQVIAYTSDKRAVVPDLLEAMRDSSEEARNNAMRALFVMASFAQGHPQSGIVIPPRAFIDLLHSIVWTDLNKSSIALSQLTAGRDPALLASLRRDALQPLAEMARWRSAGHAMPAFMILGRIAGLSEQATLAAWSAGDRSRVIDAAVRGAQSR